MLQILIVCFSKHALIYYECNSSFTFKVAQYSSLCHCSKQIKILCITENQEHPTSCSAKEAVLQWVFAEKIDPVLCVADKVKYICWETLENFLLNEHSGREAAKMFFRLWAMFENLLKLWMFVMKRT